MTADYDPLTLPAAASAYQRCACPCEHCTSFRHRPYECSLEKGGRDDWWAVGELEALIEENES